jgi:hypothetical protein
MIPGSPSFHVGHNEIHNVFDLVGSDEDSISLAIAWGLKSSPGFLKAFLRGVLGRSLSLEEISIRVHRYEAEGGITDIEIESPGALHLVVEAKRGWILPGEAQLRRYAERASFSSSDGAIRRLVTLSESSEVYARSQQKSTAIQGIPITHVSWRTLSRWCDTARVRAALRERHLLGNLREYLESVMSSQRQDSNEVYVVSLGSGTKKGWQTSWIEVVEKFGKYFHPIGKGWPKEPPNYLGFRYGGQLRSVHHVKRYEVTGDIYKVCPGIPREDRPPHFVYTLGKPIRPAHIVKNGALWPSGRVWCALDTLLTCKTVSEARDETARRKRKA